MSGGQAWTGNRRDLASGLIFAALGAGVALTARDYQLGAPSNPGPGFFPFLLGLLLVGIGAVTCVMALAAGAVPSDAPPPRLRALVWIIGPVLLFGLLLEPLGVVIDTAIVAFLSSIASREFGWRGAAVTAAVLAVLVLVVFVYGLKLQFPVWPAFLVAR